MADHLDLLTRFNPYELDALTDVGHVRVVSNREGGRKSRRGFTVILIIIYQFRGLKNAREAVVVV